MLRRLSLGFAGVVTAAIAIAACSSSDANQTISVGPNFTSQTLYAANVTQNAISIYTPNPKSTSGPLYQIGGSNTALAGPQYLTFDGSSNLWATNWLPSTSSGSLLEFKSQATGNVIPYQTLSLGNIRPRGIADTQYAFSGSTSKSDILAVAVVDPAQAAGFNSGIKFYATSLLVGAYQTLAGPNTGLNVPSGVAFDANSNLYVSNLQGASVEVFALPTATPIPSPSASASASPTASPTPAGSTPTPSPTPVATATPVNVTPIAVISGPGSGIGQPTGIALDTTGNIYVSDQASTVCAPACPAVLIFAPGSNGAAIPKFIAGGNTLLAAPTDVTVDKSGNVFVADTAAGNGVIYEFAAGATGNVAPTATLKSPGAVIGLALTP
jgi:hypothetical protein